MLAQPLDEQRGAGADCRWSRSSPRGFGRSWWWSTTCTRVRRVMPFSVTSDWVSTSVTVSIVLGRQVARFHKRQFRAVQGEEGAHVAVGAPRQHRVRLLIHQMRAKRRPDCVEVGLLVGQDDVHGCIVFSFAGIGDAAAAATAADSCQRKLWPGRIEIRRALAYNKRVMNGLPDLRYTLCFLTRGDQVLMLHRRRPPNQGLWNGVGGRLEPGETRATACCAKCARRPAYALAKCLSRPADLGRL
jgi:hypothetical protein